ncbi:MAG: RHS repeat protein [Verrucomicrobia bacterium]|nr:RHS repeat protein [Verrucomicrobiota bacterium]
MKTDSKSMSSPRKAGTTDTAFHKRITIVVGVLFAASLLRVSAEGLDVTNNLALPAGVHVFDAVTVRSNATLTLLGNPATGEGVTIVATNVTVEAGATISAAGQGFPSQQGPGGSTNENAGASHGGRGGRVTSTDAGYGSATHPVTLGSGGEPGTGAGGGAIRLMVSGALQLDGTISADATGSGHAGGSVLIETGTLVGSGSIHANGTRGVCWDCTAHFPGGGGGRIAVHYTTQDFTGSVRALGGPDSKGGLSSAATGENGTVGWFDVSNPAQVRFTAGHAWRFQANDAVGGEIGFYDIDLVDSTATVEAGVNLVRAERDFRIRGTETNSSWLGLYAPSGTLSVVASNLTVETNCTIDVSGKGFAPRQGPGTPIPELSGASHGGRGGGPQARAAYGSAVRPTELGSGGWNSAGGGAIALVVSATLQLDGTLTANGLIGGGASAGGSILLEVGELAGGGSIQANGGVGECPACSFDIHGGSGGRVAVHYFTNSFSGTVAARGGRDNRSGPSGPGGENGTVGWFDVSNPAQVRFTAGHAWRFQANDAMGGEIVFYDIVLYDSVASVEDGVRVRAGRDFILSRSAETNTATLGLYEPSGTLTLAAQNLIVNTGCVVSVTGKGFGPGAGPGTGATDSGAGHGGRGGSAFGPGGPAYGSERYPVTWGSSSEDPGGRGGGALHITVDQVLHVDGTLSANATQGGGGGSSGGSILLEARRVEGTGGIEANGGRGGCFSCSRGIAGGGGGRVAIQFAEQAFSGTAQALGGPSNKNTPSGETGTVLWAREIPIAIGGSVSIAHEALVHYTFRLDWPGGAENAVLVRMTPVGASGDWLLNGQFAQPPTVQSTAWRGLALAGIPVLEMLVPLNAAGAYYFDVFNQAWPVSGSFTLEVLDVARYVPPVFLGTGSTAGNTTLQISGIGFEPGMRVEFRNNLGQLLRSFTPTSVSSLGLTLTANLQGLSPQVVNVAVVWPDHHETLLTQVFEINGNPPGRIKITTTLPAAVRALRTYTMQVTVTNVGDSDVPVPLLRIKSDQDRAMRLSTADPFIRRPMLVVPLRAAAPFDVLPPRASIQFPVQYIPEGDAHARNTFTVESLIESAGALDWAALKTAWKPAALSATAWDLIWENFTSRAGATWAEFAETMRADARFLAEHRNPTLDLRRLLDLEFAAAAASTGVGEPRLAQLDASAPSDDPRLFFARLNSNVAFSRSEPGPFGSGWSHNFDYLLSQPSANSVLIRQPGHFYRRFFKSPKGHWAPFRHDHGILTETNGGFELKDGLATQVFAGSGRLVSIRRPDGRALTLTYTAGKLVSIAHANGGSFALAYSGDWISTLTDHAGQVTTYEYKDGKLWRVTHPGGGTHEFSYVTSGPARNAIAAMTVPGGRQRVFTYDATGRLAGQSWQGGTDPIAYTYPDIGTVAAADFFGGARRVAFNSDDFPLTVTTPTGTDLRFTYREEERTSQLELPDGGLFRLEYDSFGNPLALSDPLGLQSRMEFTPATGRLRWFEDGLGLRTEFGYNTAGNLTSMQFADGSTRAYQRNIDGRVGSIVNARGQTIAFIRDTVSGRVVEKHLPGTNTVNFAYDGAGLIEQFTDSAGSTSLAYDARHRLTNIVYPNGGSWALEFDASGRVTRMSDDTGFSLQYVHDARGRLSEIRDAASNLIISYTYDGAGRLTRENRGNSTATTYTYNPDGRITELTHLAPGDLPQERFRYGYNVNGKCVAVTNLAGQRTTFAYDGTGRLTRADYPGGAFESYSYDAAGNRTQVASTNGMVSFVTGSLNQYRTVGGQTLTYDADGNLTDDGNRQCAYDAEGRLTSVTNGPATWTYDYDGFGQRRSVTNGVAANRFLNDPTGLGWVVAEYDADGQLVARYIRGARLVAKLDSFGGIYYYGFDRSGHTRLVTDSAGAMLNQYAYSPFGTELDSTSAVPNPYRFAGAFGVATEANGLVFMRHRYYAPGLGRFISPDPTGLAGSMHPYAYAANDPVNLTDPDGLSTVTDVAVDVVFGDTPSVIPSVNDVVLDPAVDWTFNKINEVTTLPENQSPQFEALKEQQEMFDEIFPDRNLFSDSQRQEAEKGLQEAAKNVIKDTIGVLTDPVDTLKDIFKRAVKEVLDPENGGDLPDDQMKEEEEAESQTVTPGDPNEKVGWSAAGWPGITTATQTLHYVIYFENDPKIASAPAQEVIIEDALDANLDWSTFRVEEIAWGDTTVAIPADASSLETRVTVRDYRAALDKTWWVDVSAQVDAIGTARWIFRTLDPLTGDLPEDALAGFLPVNDATGRGQGHVTFSIRPYATTAIGSQIINRAVIYFDTEAPIQTGDVLFTIASQPPIVLQAVSHSGGGLRFYFQTQPGATYTVEYNDDLNTMNWVFDHTIIGDGSLLPCLIPTTNATQRFFRVRQP